MRLLICGTLAALATIHCADGAKAQGIPESARKDLGRFVGKWQIEDTVNGKVFKSEIEATWNEDRTAVLYTLRGIDPATNKTATSTGIVGWDGNRDVLVEFAVSSNGEVFSSTFHTTGDNWRCPTEGTTLVDGEFKSFTSVRILKWNQGGFELLATERTLDGEKRPDTTSTLRRVQ